MDGALVHTVSQTRMVKCFHPQAAEARFCLCWKATAIKERQEYDLDRVGRAPARLEWCS